MGSTAVNFQEAQQKVKETVAVITRQRTVDFQTDIQPILERSCLSCHSGEQAKGDFRLNSKQAILEGGHSKLASIDPGDGTNSPLIRYVTDQVEDMEMPPIGKWKRYPSLSNEEIRKLSTWIDEGAHWPEDADLSNE